MNEETLAEEIRRSLDGYDPRGDLETVRRRGRRLRLRALASAVVVTIAVVGLFVGSLVLLLPGGGTRLASPVASDTISVTCDGQSSISVTSVGVPRPDGVHFSVSNTSSSDVAFVVASFGGQNAPPGTTTVVLPIRPGATSVGCIGENRSAGDESLYRVVEIQNPDGVYRSEELPCASPLSFEREDGPTGEPQEAPLTVVREHIVGLREGDTIEESGYPESEVSRSFRVLRGAEPIGVVFLEKRDDESWMIRSLVACQAGSLTLAD